MTKLREKSEGTFQISWAPGRPYRAQADKFPAGEGE